MRRRRSYTRHGLHALKARVMVRGLSAIDRRTVAAQHLLGWRRELLEDLGGEAVASAAQLALVDVAVRTRLYLDHVDAVLIERESLVVRGRRLPPLVEQRQRLADGLARVLGQLGLERRAKPAPSLQEWLERRQAQPGGARGRAVIVVCSWCLGEDRPGFLREIPLFKDRGISDGICGAHLAEWREQLKRHAAAEAGAAGSP